MILAEATRQLGEGGYAAFTVASVRDALGLSSGSMFHAFASKAALAAAVYVEGMAAYQAEALAAIQGAPSAQAAVCAWVNTHLVWIERNRELSRYLFSTLPADVFEEAAQPLAAHNERYYAGLKALFTRATQAGLVGRVPHKVTHVLCIAAAHEYGRMWTRGLVEEPPTRVSQRLQHAALAALASTLPRSRKKGSSHQEPNR